MWHFCKNPRSIAAAERRFLGRSALPWPADLVAPLDVRCRVLQWVGTLCSGICRNFNKSEPHKAFVKFQRHNCSMKSISFGFYAQLSVVCMWLSQCIDIIYTIYILYTSIKCVSFGWPIHQPLGLKGLVFETAPNEKKKTGWTKRPSGHTEPYSKATEVGRVTLSIWSTGSTRAIPRSATSLCGVGTSEGWSSLIFFWRDVLLLMEEIHLASWYLNLICLQSCFIFQPVSRISSINGMDIYRLCNVQCMLLCFPQP